MKTNTKIMATVLAFLIIALSVIGCILMLANNDDSQVINVEANNRYVISAVTFQESDLIYDTTTKIVYINNRNGNSDTYTTYLSPNGLPYLYIDGKLVEVVR